MPTQGSCRPWVSISTSLPSTSTVRIGCRIELVGLTAKRDDDVLAGRDAAENAAGIVRQKRDLAVLHAHLVAVLLAAQRGRGEPGADLDTLDRVDRHHRAGEIAVELVVDRLAEPGRNAARDDLDDRAGRRAGLAHAVEIIGPAQRRRGVRAPERVVLDRPPIPGGAVDRVRPDLHQRAADRHVGAEDLARHRAGGDARGGLARRGAAAAAIVADAVFFPIGVVGVAGAEAVGDVAVVLRALVDVLDHQLDRRAGRLPLEDAGQDVHLVGSRRCVV